MYTPSHFAQADPVALRQLVRDHPLGLLVTQDAGGTLDANPIPFLLDDDPQGGPGVLRAHVARANPVWREARQDTETLVVFQGPQAYISPNWYPAKAEHGKVVPTWNYLMVQARGRLVVHDDPAWLRTLVGWLTKRHEATQARPWQVSDAPAEYVETMLRAIVGIEIPLSALNGKWKASQNRGAADRAGVAQGLRDQGSEVASAMADAVPTPARGTTTS
jgi:transcriptional regulator